MVGIGKTRFGAFPDRDLRSLAVEAGEKCLRNGHVSPSQVEAFFLGNFAGPSFVGQNHLAPYISKIRRDADAVLTMVAGASASRRIRERYGARSMAPSGAHSFWTT